MHADLDLLGVAAALDKRQEAQNALCVSGAAGGSNHSSGTDPRSSRATGQAWSIDTVKLPPCRSAAEQLPAKLESGAALTPAMWRISRSMAARTSCFDLPRGKRRHRLAGQWLRA